MKEKVSIIVPVYNGENFLHDCIESIVAQTYTRLEIILVNDGSTDQSGSICTFYQRRDPRITVIHQENLGPAAARNRGIEQASGTYIQFVDADDVIDKNMTEKLVSNMQSNIDLVICGYKQKSAISLPSIFKKANSFNRYTKYANDLSQSAIAGKAEHCSRNKNIGHHSLFSILKKTGKSSRHVRNKNDISSAAISSKANNSSRYVSNKSDISSAAISGKENSSSRHVRNKNDISSAAISGKENSSFRHVKALEVVSLPPFAGVLDKQAFLSQFGLLYKNMIIPSCCNKLYRLERIETARVRFGHKYRFGEDLLFNLDYFNNCRAVYLLQECLYHYRQNNDSLTNTYIANLFNKQQYLYDRVKEFLLKNNCYIAENKVLIETIFANAVIHSVTNLYHHDSPYSNVDRKKHISILLDDPKITKQLPYFTDSLQAQILHYLFSKKAHHHIHLFLRCKQFLRMNLGGLFQLLQYVNRR